MNTILQTRHLSCAYGGKTVLDDISLSFAPGKFYGILGPNGSGKTTLLRHLSGLVKPQSGAVLLGDAQLSGFPRKTLAKQISFLPQHRTVLDIPAETLVTYGRFPHLGFSQKPSAQDLHIVRDAMLKTGTAAFASRPLPTLSGGERQRVFLAMLLAQDTDVVLLDEPTTYLDARHKFEIMDLCTAMCREGKTVVAVLHDLPLALSVCDEIVLLNQGCCAAAGTPSTLYESGIFDRVFGIHLHRSTVNGKPVYTELPSV